MKIFKCLLSASIILISVSLHAQKAASLPDPKITAIVAEIDASEYTGYLLELAVNESDERGYDAKKQPQAGLVKARIAIEDAMQVTLGEANVSTQDFTVRGYNCVNIIGILPGTKRKSQQYLISAHYDSAENPGADDDASGVAGVLEAARVLSKYKFENTIVFAAFDYEEERKDEFAQGSLHYVKNAQEKEDKILGMISMDMIAFHMEDDNYMSLSRCDIKKNSKSAKLLNALATSYDAYTDLSVQAIEEEDGSDPVRFFDAGFPAVLVSEHYDDEGYPVNPYYHESSDFYLDEDGDPQQYEGKDYIDTEYACEIVRGVVGWVATKAKLSNSK